MTPEQLDALIVELTAREIISVNEHGNTILKALNQDGDAAAAAINHLRTALSASEARVAELETKLATATRDVCCAETDAAAKAYPEVDPEQPEFNQVPLMLALRVKHILKNRADADAALIARDKRVREEALREAAYRCYPQIRGTVSRGEIYRAIIALIYKDTQP